MALPVKDFATGSLRTVGGVREVIQDLVTPDLKAVKSSIEALQQELRLRTESLSHEMKIRHDALQEEIRLRDAVQTANFARLTEAVNHLANKIDGMNLDLRERVATLEARVPR